MVCVIVSSTAYLYFRYTFTYMPDWDDLRYFLAAARTGSLSAAARTLDSNQPTVGRRIARLEQTLDLRLFQRHARGLTLTEDGVRVLESAELMERGALGLNRAQLSLTPDISGTVRVSAPEGLALRIVAPALGAFLDRHPRLDLNLSVSAATADLVRGEADIAIRLFRPTSGDIVTRRLQTMDFGLYAATRYFAERDRPLSTDPLADHHFIACGDLFRRHKENEWLEKLSGKARKVLRSDSTLLRLEATEQGLGIAVMPHLVAAASPGLEPVLPELEGPSRTIWIAVHRDLRHVPRIRAVMGFLTQTIRTADARTGIRAHVEKGSK